MNLVKNKYLLVELDQMMKIYSQMKKEMKVGNLIVKWMNSKRCFKISCLKKLKKKKILSLIMIRFLMNLMGSPRLYHLNPRLIKLIPSHINCQEYYLESTCPSQRMKMIKIRRKRNKLRKCQQERRMNLLQSQLSGQMFLNNQSL